MAAEDIAAMRILIDASIAPLQKQMSAANSAVARSMVAMAKETEKTNAAFAKMGDRIKTAITGALAAVSLAKLTSLTKEGLKWADALEDQAQWLGVGVEKLQEWQFAANQTGIDGAKLGDALEKLRANLAEAASDPNSSGAQLFRSLGISITDAQGKLKGLEAQIPTLADAVARLQGGDKLNLAKALFGERNTGMIRFLEGGSAALQAFARQGREAGQVLEREIIARNAALNKQYQAMTTAIDLDVKRALTDLGPVLLYLTGLAGGLARVVANIGRDTNLGDLERRIKIHQEQMTPEGARKLGITDPKDQARLAEAAAAKLREAEAARDAMAETRVAEGYGDIFSVSSRFTNLGVPKPTGSAGAGKESELERTMRRLGESAAAARAELEKGPSGAAWSKIEADMVRLRAGTEKTTEAAMLFSQELRDRGMIALQDFGRETELARQTQDAEIAGKKELVIQLQLEAQFRRATGQEIDAATQKVIAGTAAARAEMERMGEQARAWQGEVKGATDSIRGGIVDSVMTPLGEAGSAAEKLRQIWANVFDQMSRRLLDFALDQAWQGILQNIASMGSGLGGAGLGQGIAEGGVKGGAGGGGLGGILSGILSFAGGLLGFAEGGSFRVPGSGGTDTTPISFMATPGEEVTVRTPEQVRRGGSSGGGTINLYGSNSDKIEIGQLKDALQRLGMRVNQVDSSIGPRSVAAVVDMKRRGGAAANVFS